MDAAWPCSLGAMDGEEDFDLAHDRLERARFVSVGGSDGVAVHGVADPQNVAPFFCEAAEQGGEGSFDLFCPHAHDEGDASGSIVWVEQVEQAQQFVGFCVCAAFDAERIMDAA